MFINTRKPIFNYFLFAVLYHIQTCKSIRFSTKWRKTTILLKINNHFIHILSTSRFSISTYMCQLTMLPSLFVVPTLNLPVSSHFHSIFHSYALWLYLFSYIFFTIIQSSLILWNGQEIMELPSNYSCYAGDSTIRIYKIVKQLKKLENDFEVAYKKRLQENIARV